MKTRFTAFTTAQAPLPNRVPQQLDPQNTEQQATFGIHRPQTPAKLHQSEDYSIFMDATRETIWEL